LGYLPQSFEVMGFSSVMSNVEYAVWAHGVAEGEVHSASIDALRSVLVEDVARLADRVMVMSEGKLLYSGPTDDLIATVPGAVDRADAIEQAFRTMESR
jgi:ABC-type multidrug transport system ATPase subunit